MESIAAVRAAYQAAEESKLPDFIRKYEEDTRSGVRTLCAQAKKRIEKREAEVRRVHRMRLFENETAAPYAIVLRNGGRICGIDEAGRGPLAGPVAAGACILPADHDLLYLNDSKKLSEARREALYEEITKEAVAWAVGIVSPERIDEINILQATYEAMRQAVGALSVQPALLINDAVRIPGIRIPQIPVIKGDAKCISVAAASILAKVTRDRLMQEYDGQYPEYGFAGNKGYGSPAHIEALQKYGPCPIHRRSFITHFVTGESAASGNAGGTASGAVPCSTSDPAAGNVSGAQKSRWELGRQGEAIAAAYLRERGMRIAESNFRAAQGEIDLIGYDGDTLCFIEVKYRETERAGSPEEAVTTQKQRVICRTADYYRHLHRLDDTVKIRFDVVAVRSEGEDIHWIRNAFAYTGMGS